LIVEWADDEVTEQTLTLDGRDNVSTGLDEGRRVQNATLSSAKDTLIIDSRTSFVSGERPVDVRTRDVWTLRRRGRQLVIARLGESPGGPVESVLRYDKQPP
jgi:hypothetical protein